jgi:hypothetical protein
VSGNSKPNPGSFEAIAMGCLCPVMDNNVGKVPPRPGEWWIDERCPVHGDGRELVST